ncbi:histidine phosphatase family protein [Pelagibius sp.]|uniref:histidine phosphatase family protein n=1 Tax=Pelagibius sp. TaxID=1931238 RepID=UPI003BB02A27
MTALLLIRHGPTAWNEQGLIQGRSDPPLSDKGRSTVVRWCLPAAADNADWIVSPLQRARQTAEILNRKVLRGGALRPEPRLVEADWGAWEGRRLAELRAEGGAQMAENEARGLDFQPPKGESPRMVQQRLAPLLSELADRRQTVVAVTHKGVIRALYALASGWDMREKPADKLQWSCAHGFELSAGGKLRISELNIPLQTENKG